jgi:sortase A
MRDRRSVDDLSIEELEQALRIKKRQARLARLQRYDELGRRIDGVPTPDEIAPPEPPPPDDAEKPAPAERTLRDKLLLAVEIAAAAGLITILVVMGVRLDQLNREVATLREQELAGIPTPTPTPIISAVVLPGGHTPPTAPGGAQPNYDEVPAHLRPVVEQQFTGPVTIPTPGPGNAIRIQIPAIDVDARVEEGDGWEQLRRGVGHHIGSANPGERGNMVFSAHNDIFGEIFRHLDRLGEGDEVIVSTQTQSYTYRVVEVRIVEPTEVAVMDPTHEPTTTLISCYPYLADTQRIVVIAALED